MRWHSRRSCGGRGRGSTKLATPRALRRCIPLLRWPPASRKAARRWRLRESLSSILRSRSAIGLGATLARIAASPIARGDRPGTDPRVMVVVALALRLVLSGRQESAQVLLDPQFRARYARRRRRHDRGGGERLEDPRGGLLHEEQLHLPGSRQKLRGRRLQDRISFWRRGRQPKPISRAMFQNRGITVVEGVVADARSSASLANSLAFAMACSLVSCSGRSRETSRLRNDESASGLNVPGASAGQDSEMHGLTLSTHSESTTYLERGGAKSISRASLPRAGGECRRVIQAAQSGSTLLSSRIITVRYSPAAALVAEDAVLHIMRGQRAFLA